MAPSLSFEFLTEVSAGIPGRLVTPRLLRGRWLGEAVLSCDEHCAATNQKGHRFRLCFLSAIRGHFIPPHKIF